MNQTIKINSNCKYLSEFIDKLPSHCLINKGITGCGGTTVELTSKRDSIILCPTRNLVTSKSAQGYFGVDGNVTKTEIRNYLLNERGYRKIVATYDALEKLIEVIPDYQNYFLLIDEYHLLFNDYSFRSKAIMFILNNFYKFKDWAFLTATPLKEEFILEELKDIDQVTYEWENSTPVNITIQDTYFVQKKLLELINIYKDRNLHIFLNSVSTIYKIVEKLNMDFRVVCSESSKTKIKNFAKITDPVKKLNFYTSCAFEGTDIYDPDGYNIIICDTNIATTVLDIATKIRQICGRIRDSKYKDQCTIILNTNKHRYAGVSKSMFQKKVEESEKSGKMKVEVYNSLTVEQQLNELKYYDQEIFANQYVNYYNNELFYDENLKKLDIYNYNLISEIYNSSISVLNELKSESKFIPKLQKEIPKKGLSWIVEYLQKSNKLEYTYQELEEIFKPLFKEHNLKWNKNTSINTFFPECKKQHKKIKGERYTVYNFNI